MAAHACESGGPGHRRGHPGTARLNRQRLFNPGLVLLCPREHSHGPVVFSLALFTKLCSDLGAQSHE